MSSRINGSLKRTNVLNHVNQKVPNWIVIVGGALLSTLSIRLCCRLKQVFDFRRRRKTHAPSKEDGNSTPIKRRESCKFCSQKYCFIPNEDGGYHCFSGAEHSPATPISKENDDALQLVKVSSKENNGGVMWESSPHLLHPPSNPFNHSNTFESPSPSESGSDIYSKREIVRKLRQQLKRRDDMIAEMQSRIADLQTHLTFEIARTAHLQDRINSSNRRVLDSEREIRRLRNAVSDR